jgi:hypothetical protein
MENKTSKERLQATLNHIQPDKMVIDFGATAVTGIHCKVVERLREHYGLEKRPVRIIEPFQMLGEVDSELKEIIGIDTVPLFGSRNMFDIDETVLHEQVTPWGQKVLIANDIDLSPDSKGDVNVYARGDKNFPPSAIMPSGCYFVNAIERQKEIDDENLDAADNLEEIGHVSEADLEFFSKQVDKLAAYQKGIVASFGNTALGDIAFIPGMGLSDPKGIRTVSEWYMSTMMRQDYIHQVFEKQTDIAIENYKKLWKRLGSKVDVVFTCGTDFGTQDSQFCSPETFSELWLPHYKRMNAWIHENTTWKVFKHSCGAILPILPGLIEAGFDIINPVQINAKDMDTQHLKTEFGSDLTFWGGGIDTQKVLPNYSIQQIREHVLNQCEILSKNGGFVFNSVHNIQANVPIANLIATIEAINEFNK